MSKFIDKLNRLTRGESSSLGFRKEQSARSSVKIQLVASLNEGSGDITGADTVLINVSGKGADEISVPEVSEGTPWGGRLRGEYEDLKKLAEAGYDYIVFDTGTPLETTGDTTLGKILEIDATAADSMLRGVSELPVDGVLVSTEWDKGKSLTWQDLIVFQRFAGMIRKPVLACVPATVTGRELAALWEAGVIGVVVEAKTKDGISKIRKVIDKTDFATLRKREKVEPVLSPRENV